MSEDNQKTQPKKQQPHLPSSKEIYYGEKKWNIVICRKCGNKNNLINGEFSRKGELICSSCHKEVV